jgi:hypothetical protein
MRRVKRLLLLALAIAAALSASISPVAAKATKTAFWVVEGQGFLLEPADSTWVDDENVLHVRGEFAQRPFVRGDFQGYAQFTFNLNMDLATGEGVGWGEVTLYVESWQGREGTFQGHFAIKLPLVPDARKELIAHGTGDMEGMKLVGYFTDLPMEDGEERMLVEGTILDPHGN